MDGSATCFSFLILVTVPHFLQVRISMHALLPDLVNSLQPLLHGAWKRELAPDVFLSPQHISEVCAQHPLVSQAFVLSKSEDGIATRWGTVKHYGGC